MQRLKRKRRNVDVAGAEPDREPVAREAERTGQYLDTDPVEGRPAAMGGRSVGGGGPVLSTSPSLKLAKTKVKPWNEESGSKKEEQNMEASKTVRWEGNDLVEWKGSFVKWLQAVELSRSSWKLNGLRHPSYLCYESRDKQLQLVEWVGCGLAWLFLGFHFWAGSNFF
jgi:hypothetical protein